MSKGGGGRGGAGSRGGKGGGAPTNNANQPSLGLEGDIRASALARENEPILLSQLREKTGLSHAEFDKQIWDLIDKGNVYPIRHNYTAELSPRERKALIHDSASARDPGSYFAVQVRNPHELSPGKKQ